MRGPHRRDAECLALESVAAEPKVDRETVLGAVKQNALALESVAAELKADCVAVQGSGRPFPA